jgi:hypothetical protein
MFCPECRAEYRSGFVHCPDCDTDLVQELSECKNAPKLKRNWPSPFPTTNRIYTEGRATVRWWKLYKQETGHLALVFHRGPFHELGCDLVWRGLPRLVDWRTPFVTMAIPENLCAGSDTVRHSRELDQKSGEAKPFTKAKAARKTVR